MTLTDAQVRPQVQGRVDELSVLRDRLKFTRPWTDGHGTFR